MAPLWLVLLLAAEPTATVVQLKEREPLIILLSAAKNVPVDISELLAVAAPIFERQTSFELLSPERAGIDPDIFAQCTEHRIACWYRRLLETNRAPSVLLVGIFAKSPGVTEQLAIYFDEKENPKNIAPGENDEELENRLLAHAKETPRREVRARDRASLEQYFQRLVTEELQAELARNNRLDAFGAVELRALSSGTVVEIDGIFAATAAAPSLRLEGLRPGPRKLSARAAGGKEILLETAIAVKPKETVELVMPAPPSPRDDRLLFWSGTALAASGAALTIYALARNETPDYLGCAGAACGVENERRFSSFCRGEDCEGLGTTRIAPLGYSLFLTGAVWAISELLTDGDATYVAMALGVAGGIAAYGVSVAAE